MEGLIQHIQFNEINLKDTFFDSLKDDYSGFEEWFSRKSKEKAYVLYNEGKTLEAFLYLKVENGPILDVLPNIQYGKVLKIGTLKINPHGTRLGERFLKKAIDLAIDTKVECIYVTVFKRHEPLVALFKKYGFVDYGKKENHTGEELVLLKSLKAIHNDQLLDYPRVSQKGKKKYLLSIFPEFHTRLFPDSILRNESFNVIEDVSHTNSIHKAYISFAPISNLNSGDLIVIYRTSDKKGPAKYRSVATSICVVEEMKSKSDFISSIDFIDYCKKHSIFTTEELKGFYEEHKRINVIKMTYNIALRKRLTRERLIDEVGIDPNERWTFINLTETQFESIIMAGDIHESLIVD